LSTHSNPNGAVLWAAAFFVLASLGSDAALSQETVASPDERVPQADAALPAGPITERAMDEGEADAGDPDPGESMPARREISAEEILADIPPEVLAEGNKHKDEFLRQKKELVETLIEMRGTYLRYVNEEDQSPTAVDQYRQYRNKSRELMNQLFESGLKVTRYIPDEEVIQYLLTALEHRMKHDFFDAASMEAGATLLDGRIEQSFLYPATLRAAIVNGDFELARKLAEVLDIEKLEEIDQKLIYLIDDYEKQYKEDQALQKEDDKKDNNPRVKMVTTKGVVTIELFINQAPSTVANFVQLVEEGFYDGLDFYQVIDHLLALTGDASGDGSGHTGKFLMDENNRPAIRHGLAGSLVMAKRPLSEGKFVPNSSSSQFAILFLPVVGASKTQTVFGRVIDGLDVVGELRRVDPSKKKKKNAIVLPPDRILSMEMIRRPKVLPEIQYFDPHGAGSEGAAGHNHSHGPTLPSSDKTSLSNPVPLSN
jgi:peptidylprolyl isomerase